MKPVYVWGIDLAQANDYCAIVIGRVTDVIQIANIRKFNQVLYPNIVELCMNELRGKWAPAKIATDYTSQQGFSEELEARFNPLFINESSHHHKRWTVVKPVSFTKQTKLDMKQNSRLLHEDNLVDYPDPRECSAEQAPLVVELQDQARAEVAVPATGGGLTFPKPDNQKNDLVIAFELMLFVARPYLGDYDGDTVVASAGDGGLGEPDNHLESIKRRMRNWGYQNAEVSEYKPR